MDIDRINELNGIIDDANKKMQIIEDRINAGGLSLDKQAYHLDMFYLNMDRRSLCQEEITKLMKR